MDRQLVSADERTYVVPATGTYHVLTSLLAVAASCSYQRAALASAALARI